MGLLGAYGSRRSRIRAEEQGRRVPYLIDCRVLSGRIFFMAMAEAYRKLTNAQIDRLGQRLKKGHPSEQDLILLEEFRQMFRPAYNTIIQTVREMKLEPTGRPTKSTPSIIEKLRREHTRLTQIQDIVGCRIVVPDCALQNTVVLSLENAFERSAVIDRRAKPSYGYRAVHVVARVYNVPVEIQVRTHLQHKWAELSEKLSDVIDNTIKYGGGPDQIKSMLSMFSKDIGELEEFEYNLRKVSLSHKEDAQKEIADRKHAMTTICEDLIKWLVEKSRAENDIPN